MRNPHLTAPGGGPVDWTSPGWTSPGWDWQAVGGVRRGGEGGCGRTRVRRCAGAPSARGAVGGGPFLPVQPPTPVPRPSSIHPLSPLLSSPARPAPRASPGSRTWRPQPVTQHTEKKKRDREIVRLNRLRGGAPTSLMFCVHTVQTRALHSPYTRLSSPLSSLRHYLPGYARKRVRRAPSPPPGHEPEEVGG